VRALTRVATRGTEENLLMIALAQQQAGRAVEYWYDTDGSLVLKARLPTLGIEIDSDTAATRWRGERMDYELGVWVLCQEHSRAQHDHAQTEREAAEHEATDHDEVDPASNAANDVSAETSWGFAGYS
jgi:hypothetical protein